MIVLVIDVRKRLFRAALDPDMLNFNILEVGVMMASQHGVPEASLHSMRCWS